MRSRRLLALLIVAASVLLVARRAGLWLVDSVAVPPHADAIVVLAGSLSDRVLEAADLYRDGFAPLVIVTREQAPRGEWALRQRGVKLPDADEQRRSALAQLGVPATAVVRIRRRAYSTESEAANVAQYACRHHLRRLIVVTSAAHTWRAGMIFRAALGPGREVTMRASRYDPFPARHWWRVRDAAKLVLSEYQKLANYFLHQRWKIRPCGGLRKLRPDRPPA